MASSRIRGLARLTVEELEPRLPPAGLQPTPIEQEFLERLNDARANPAAYGRSIGLNLAGIPPSGVLGEQGCGFGVGSGGADEYAVDICASRVDGDADAREAQQLLTRI